ncbi:MAG: hypothetical protein OHK0057_22200 [Thermoflexibacter sp.]
MKIYTVFLKDLDNSQSFSHLVGSFDSKEKFILALQEIEKELEITIQSNDYDVFETDLNKNFLLFEQQIMK